MSLPADEVPEPRELQPRRGSILDAFQHRNYRLFFAGQLFSLMGTWMQSIAQGWLVYRMTASPFLLGFVAFAGQGPVLFLSAFGGTLADRFDRRTIVLATQVVSMALATTLAVLTLAGAIEVWHVAVLALGLGVVNALDIPTRQAFTIELVGRKDLHNAIALNSVMFNAARIVGPAAAGLLVAIVGEGWCFAINAASYIAVIASLLMMRVTKPAPRTPDHPIKALAEGFRYVVTHREIRAGLLLLAMSSMFGASYLALMPVFARDVLHAGSYGYGFMMTCVGAGALVGAFTLSLARREWVHLLPVVGAFAFGVALMAFSRSTELWLSLSLLVPAGFSLMMQGVSTNTLIQTQVEDRMRGRVMAYYTMAFMGLMPVGALISGTLAHAMGVANTVTLGGAICALGAVATYFVRHRGK